MSIYSKLLLFACGLLTIIWISGFTEVAYAQRSEINWPAPRRVPGYGDESRTPIMVVDQNRTIHAFSSQWIGEQLAIMYNQWTLERDWTTPVDILLPPAGQARVLGAHLDESGMMHIVFWSGDDRSASIYYSYVSAIDAANATAWSRPLRIGRHAVAPEAGLLVGDGKDFLMVLYAGQPLGRGVYAVYSHDGGETWAQPEPIFLTYTTGLWTIPLVGYKDSQDQFHVMWGLPDGTGNSTAIYYTRMDMVTQHWSEAVEYATAIDFEADTPAIVEHEGELFAVYHNDFPTTRWMRRSRDGGVTWSDPVRLFEHVGSNGAAAMVVDGNGDLHMFFGNRVGNPSRNNMWHSVWQGDSWSNPVGLIVRDSPAWRDPSFANAIVSQNDTIFLTWRTDPGSGPNGVWYTYANIDAPAWPRQPLPEPVQSALLTPIPEEILWQDVDSEAIIEDAFETGEESTEELNISSYAQLLLFSTLPAGLFVVLVVAFFGFRNRSRRD